MVLRKLFDIGADVNGKGPVTFAWSHDGAYCAIAGTNHKVSIVDRQGKSVHQFFASGNTGVIALEWDSTNEVLAVLQDKAQLVTMFTLNGKKVDMIETGIKDLCFMKWSKVGPQLALGSLKGGVLVYNRQTAKKMPILGTHSKKIVDGAWNSSNKLAMVAEDKILSISDEDGNVLDQLSLKSLPTAVSFMDLKAEERQTKKDNYVCVILAQKSLYLHCIAKKETPIELTFQAKYGNIVCTRFTDDGYCLVGFQSGYCNLVSVHESELGTEVSALKAYRDALTDVSYAPTVKKCATVGDSQVRTFDMDDGQISDQKSEKFDLDADFGALTSVSWSEDGQILTVASKNGAVYGLLTKISALSASCGTFTLFLSSLRELTVRNVDTEQEVCRIPIDMEPNFVAIGQGTAALGMNNQVSFYGFTPPTSKKDGGRYNAIGTKVYPGVVEQLHLSSTFAAVLFDGKVLLHVMDPKNPNGLPNTEVNFPEQNDVRITTLAMCENFLIYAGESRREGSQVQGRLVVVSLLDFQVVVDYTHTSAGIKKVFPNTLGTRIAFMDSGNAGFVLNPCTEVATRIENLKSGTTRLLWDVAEYGVLAGVDAKRFTTYVYTPNSRHGPTCDAIMKDASMSGSGAEASGEVKAHTTALPYGFAPVLLLRGNITCQMPNGTLATVHLATHKNVYSATRADTDAFRNNMNLNRLQQAFSTMSTPEETLELAKKSLHLLDIDTAMRTYRMLQQPTLVLCLEKIRHIQEKNVLIGHVSLILGHFNDAQTFFLRSSRPMLALEMRRDLMHWEQCLQLAKTMAEDQVPFISKEFAQQLEFRGEHSKALEHFQSARMVIPKGHISSELTAAQHEAIAHNEACQAGAARCMIRTGNIRGGIQVVQALQSNAIALDCAKILESMKQHEDAGNMYEKAEEYERAATIYILETKNLKAAARVIPKITSRSILVMYAKAKESIEGNFKDAEAAYAQAEDWDNVVRIKVEHLGDLHGAYVVVRKTRSAEAAAMVAKMCKKKGENGAAVEFLVLAKKAKEAFELAQSSQCMEHFEGALLAQTQLKDGVATSSSKDDFSLVANYYDQRGKPDLAAQFFHIAGNFPQALTKYLQSGSEEAIEKAVSVVGKARSDALTNRLIDYLMGESDGRPKDPSYIFKLYLALGSYEKAAKTSVLIAVKEQEIGNYRKAHQTLVETCMVLQEKGLRITSDMRRALVILHSYLIVKHIVKPLEDNDNASRMLLRVAHNIAKFPKHIALILTSTVIQCLKAEFNKSAFDFACVLLQNEQYRAELNEKHKKKVEGLVRKRGSKEEMTDPVEAVSPCPHCAAPVPETSLECGACKNPLPFCIVTGKHMLVDDWCQCPHCNFPALFTPFLKLLRDASSGGSCPMCEGLVDPSKLRKVVNPEVKNFI